MAATLAGSKAARNGANDSFACVLQIDGQFIADSKHQFCKFLWDQPLLVSPGKHLLRIGYGEESGLHFWGDGKFVDVDLQAGRTYKVERRTFADDLVRVWVADDHGAPVSGSVQFSTVESSADVPTRFLSETAEPLPGSFLRPFVYADFGANSQPFEAAFTRELRALGAACRIEIGLLTAPHATGLTLNPPVPPTEAEIAARVQDFRGDGLLRLQVTNWSSAGGAASNSFEPIRWGSYTLLTGFSQTAPARPVWQARIEQQIRGDTGGDQLARAIFGHLTAHGAFPQCPDVLPQ